MTASLALACLWAVAATVIALMPARLHWRAPDGLIGLGIPPPGRGPLPNGPVWGLAVLAAGVSLLRWPVIRLWQRLGRRHGAVHEPAE